MNKIKIKETEILLENFEKGQGKIIITNPYDYNFSMYWGSMGEKNIESFLKTINEDYFSTKLLGSRKNYTIDVKRTFTELRKFIKEEINLPWYKFTEFQIDMRKVINIFQESCQEIEREGADRYFVDCFQSQFVNRLDFSLIDSRYDAEDLEKEFKNISEPWHFICNKDNHETVFLKKLHKQLKKIL